MKRWMFAAAVFCVLTLGGDAQAPLPPPTAVPTALATSSPIPTEQPATVASPEAASNSETSMPTQTIDPLITPHPLDLTVTAEVLFPAGIAFHVAFRTPEAGLSSITMTAEQDAWDGETIEINPVEVHIDESGVSVFTYWWTIDENAPRLFEPLTITWAITPRGTATESAQVEVSFADSRVMWAIMESNGLPAKFAAADSRTTAAVINAQMTALSELLEAAGREIPPVNVVLFPSGVVIDPCKSGDILTGSQITIETSCDSERAASLYAEQGWDVAAVTSAVPMREIVVEKVVRSTYPTLFASEDVPEWFKVGLVAYLSGSFNANELEIARSASRNNSHFPSLDFVPSDAETHQWHVQSTGIVVYMASQIGVIPMLEMLDRIDSGEAMEDVWLDQSQQPLNVLNVAWRNWIFSFRAEAAYNSPPSLAPTLTLVPTRTSTFTPTATSTLTPSATWTNTPTPSITPTMTPSVASGFEQPTAAPTQTPTATLRPSITPLPAVLFSLDETVEETPSPLDRSLAIAGTLAVLVVVLSAVFLIVSRRRK